MPNQALIVIMVFNNEVHGTHFLLFYSYHFLKAVLYFTGAEDASEEVRDATSAKSTH